MKKNTQATDNTITHEASVPTREELETMMERGEDVEQYMGEVRKGIPKVEPRPHDPVRVNVDFTYSVVKELNELSVSLNVSRQSVIKMLIRTGLDQLQSAEHLRRSKTA